LVIPSERARAFIAATKAGKVAGGHDRRHHGHGRQWRDALIHELASALAAHDFLDQLFLGYQGPDPALWRDGIPGGGPGSGLCKRFGSRLFRRRGLGYCGFSGVLFGVGFGQRWRRNKNNQHQ
jgi:hypothetical protein